MRIYHLIIRPGTTCGSRRTSAASPGSCPPETAARRAPTSMEVPPLRLMGLRSMGCAPRLTSFASEARNSMMYRIQAQYWSSGGAAHGYIPEVAWNESGSNGGKGLWSSGGGYSTFSSNRVGRRGIRTNTGECRMSRFQPRRTMDIASVSMASTCNSSGLRIPSAELQRLRPPSPGLLHYWSRNQAAQGNVNQTMYATGIPERFRDDFS